MAGLGALAFAVPLVIMGVAVPTAMDVVVGRGCGRNNFRGGSYGRGKEPLVTAITWHKLN